MNDYLFLTQEITVRPYFLLVTDNLEFTKEEKSNFVFERVRQSINLSQNINNQYKVKNITISDYLDLRSTGNNTEFGSYTDFLIMFGVAKSVEFEALQQLFTLLQSLSVNNTKGVSSLLGFSQEVNYNVSFARQVTQTIILGNFVSSYQNNKYIINIEIPDLNTPEC
jgi:hypothetical protein